MFMQTRHGNCKIYRPRVRISGHIPAIQYERERERERDPVGSHPIICHATPNHHGGWYWRRGTALCAPPVITASYKCLATDGPIRSHLHSLVERLFTENSIQGDENSIFFSLFPLTTDIDLSVPLIGNDSEFEPLWHDRHSRMCKYVQKGSPWKLV